MERNCEHCDINLNVLSVTEFGVMHCHFIITKLNLFKHSFAKSLQLVSFTPETFTCDQPILSNMDKGSWSRKQPVVLVVV